MEIVVKAFSRPFYLDRCLLSIRSFLDGHEGVTVLDDGLLPTARRHLETRHPEVRFVTAPWAEEKAHLVRDRLRRPLDGVADRELETAQGQVSLQRVLVWPQSMDPLIFWKAAIGALGCRTILMLEEDTWITGHLDLAALEAAMDATGCLATGVYFQPEVAVGRVRERHPVGEEAFLELLDLPLPPDRALADSYFPVSLMAMRRDYWLDATAHCQSWLPESPIHDRAVALVAEQCAGGFRPAFGRVVPAVLAHGFSLSTRVPPSQYGEAISLYDISDLLTLIWQDGALDPMRGYPADFPESYLQDMISRRLGENAAGEWLSLRRTYEAGYVMALHDKRVKAQ